MHFYKFGNRAKKHRISITLIRETLSAIISKPLRRIASICQAVSTSQQRNYTATKCIFEFSVSRLKTGRKQTRKFSFFFFIEERTSEIRSRTFSTWISEVELELIHRPGVSPGKNVRPLFVALSHVK